MDRLRFHNSRTSHHRGLLTLIQIEREVTFTKAAAADQSTCMEGGAVAAQQNGACLNGHTLFNTEIISFYPRTKCLEMARRRWRISFDNILIKHHIA